jgi:hypothetical protein
MVVAWTVRSVRVNAGGGRGETDREVMTDYDYQEGRVREETQDLQ